MTPSFLAPLFGNVWAIALILFFFGASIFVHELGHFLAARKRGLKVERFSIGFGPKIFGWTRDGVEYRVSWLPLGGYVALPQLADMRGIEGESPDAERLPPISYTDKMIVSVMGAVFNIIFAFLLACVLWGFGRPTTDMQQTTRIGHVSAELPMPDGSRQLSPAAEAGLQPGDRITAVDGRPVDDWMSFQQTLVASSGRAPDGRAMSTLTIERGNESLQLTVFPLVSGEENIRRIGVLPYEDLVVGSVRDSSPAALAGLQPGDRILAVDGEPLFSQSRHYSLINQAGGQPLVYSIERDGQPLQVTVTAASVQLFSDRPPAFLDGIEFRMELQRVYEDPFTQVGNAFSLTWRVLGALISPRSDLGVQHLSGPVGIARILYIAAQQGILLVLWITLIINVNLAVLNLLPIPVLDGGHMVFATIGKLRGRPLPPMLLVRVQTLFMLLLLSLMVYVTFNDSRRWVRDSREERRFTETYTEPTFGEPEEPGGES
jgi:regulator of sigma E protease